MIADRRRPDPGVVVLTILGASVVAVAIAAVVLAVRCTMTG